MSYPNITHQLSDFKHGQRFQAWIHGELCDGKVCVEPSGIYLCQNRVQGLPADDRLGYRYSWTLTSEHLQNLLGIRSWAKDIHHVKDLTLFSDEPKNKSLTEILSL
jgi:hypothetical protein